jgi:hypothetical protein
MHVSEILDLANLEKMLREKYIHASESPDGKLSIYNYTPKAQFEQVWDQETEICRGLVLENGTGNVIARAFRKFFNATPEDLKARAGQPFRAFDKMDGSLVIVFNYDNKTRLATRGSFVSDQAIAAGQYWAEHHSTVVVPRSETWCFEWVGPSNPIVLRYDEDELILLARIRTSTGRDVEADKNTVLYGPTGYISKKFPQAEEFNFDSLELPHRENTEGYVLLFPDGVRLKVKEAEYLELHRAIFNISNKAIWEVLSSGADFKEYISILPDEWQKFALDTAAALQLEFDTMKQRARKEFWDIMQHTGLEWSSVTMDPESKKTFAMEAKDSPNSSLLFGMYAHWADSEIDSVIWKRIKPVYIRPSFVPEEEE